MLTAVARAVSCELLKLKRTLALRMVVLAPALVALLTLLAQSAAVRNERRDLIDSLWLTHAQTALMLWTLFLLPLLITVETALLSGIEHADKQWKHLFALPVPRPAIYFAKFVIAQLLMLASTLVLCAFIVASGYLLILWHPALAAAGLPPLWSIVSRALACWLAAGLILSINLWIALRWPSFTVPLAAGIGGTFFALFATSAAISKYYPWLLPLNVLTPERARLALALGVGGGALVAALGCIDFSRREESAAPQLSRPAMIALIAILTGFAGLAAYLDWGVLSNRHVSHKVQFIPVDANVRLEVLDWGGSGRPIVLLSGLGDTAHIFDSFALKLTGSYHVYGITRRGFGASSRPSSGYSADRLGDDVVAVIDSLKLRKPVLVGHSIAGEELSSVGLRHPDKIAGLVYLDAAYAYAYYDPVRGDFNIDLFALDEKLQKLKPGSGVRDPRALIEALADSLPAFEHVLRAHLQQLDTFSDHSATNERPKSAAATFEVAKAVVAGERKFGALHVPILAIYALPHDMGAGNTHAAEAEARDMAYGTGPQAKAFEAAVPSARVVRLPHASHYVFRSNEADVLREMRVFIDRLPN